MTTPLAQSVLALLASSGIVELRQLAIPSEVTYPGPNLLPESPVEGFTEAWDAIAADWNGPGSKPGNGYVESHAARGRDVLVTDDRGMQTMCRRLHDEQGIDTTAQSLADYAALFST
jgi:hypothetical protein